MDSTKSLTLERRPEMEEPEEDDHVSPSLEVEERRTPQQQPSTAGETDVSLLPAFSPAVTVDDTQTVSAPANPTAEGASIVLVKETLPISPHEATADVIGGGDEPALLGGEASQELLLAPPAAPFTIAADVLDARGERTEEEEAVVVVMTGEDDTDAEAAAAAARGTAIQDKYSATSQWVESLPLSATPSLVVIDDAPDTAARAHRGKRTRESKDDTQNTEDADVGGTRRQRRAREKAAEVELQTAFKHSQRALRRQAKSVSMRDVFARSIAVPSPLALSDVAASATSPTFPSTPLGTAADATTSNGAMRAASGAVFSPSSSSFRFGSSVFSPAGALSPTTPSGSRTWSPCVVGELTSQFLANVKSQRHQKCEQFVSREWTQSQTLSQTRSFHTHPPSNDGEDHRTTTTPQPQPQLVKEGDPVPANAFSAPVDELVIGDEDNEAANWMPADTSSPASPQGRRVMRDTNANDDVVLLGASSAGEEARYTTSPSTTASDSRKAEDFASQQQHQQQVVQSLARKHEIWKLKQRELKAQQQVDLDERAKAKQQQEKRQPNAVSSTKLSATAPSVAVSSASVIHGSAVEVGIGTDRAANGASFSATTTTTSTHQNFFRTSQITSPSSAASPTLRKANLSADAISMIRRINSFDNTSTQRVVVFGTAASAKQSKEENTQ